MEDKNKKPNQENKKINIVDFSTKLFKTKALTA